MIEPVTFSLSGLPRGKKSTHSRGGFIPGVSKGRGQYAHPQTAEYERSVGIMAGIAMRGRVPIDDCVAMDLLVVLPIPRSWSQRKQQMALVGDIAPGVKPDLSNVLKAVEDGIKGIIITDDARIVKFGRFEKVYGVTPKVVVTIRDRRSVPSLAQTEA